jgi:hypothetical protein
LRRNHLSVDFNAPEKVLGIKLECRGVPTRKLDFLNQNEFSPGRRSPAKRIGELLRCLPRKDKGHWTEAGSSALIDQCRAEPEEAGEGDPGEYVDRSLHPQEASVELRGSEVTHPKKDNSAQANAIRFGKIFDFRSAENELGFPLPLQKP